ncbi:protein NLP6-like isoform X2 [Rutidosis leptorrhynchoides]|uniref:protein NLP6-like isoform X2 n=1 Tax=Rutidosis leptorrhynchoides TaxID=125765 RepID=UPI003A98F61C
MHHQEITYKLKAALKLLTFREQHVLVQFWSPHVVGKHQLLTTIDQPFGLSVVVENLCFYRKDSEKNAYIVGEDLEEEDHSPPARVFKRGLPEWTSDITNYNPKDFPQLKSAISCNLHGYLALPVVDSATGSCLGVLELLMSSTYTSYSFEVQEVHKALKTENLTSPQVFDRPTSKVPNERKRNECNILSIIKEVSDIHNIPLAQTWAMSPTSSYVSHENVIKKSCSSFNIRCIGKECMYTTSLPFHVRDLGKWEFREACRNQHIDKSHSFVGQALLAHGSGYCENVTELTEDEYPLVHYARMSGLATCFTIFLRTVEGDDDYQDYVLEFFLMLDDKDSRRVISLVQTLKQKVDVVSGFQLGQISSIEIIGPPKDADYLSSIINPRIIKISSTTFDKGFIDSESFLDDVSKADLVHVASQLSCTQNHSIKQSDVIGCKQSLARNNVISCNINEVGLCKTDNSSTSKLSDITNVGTMNHSLKKGRKCKIKSLTMKSLEQHIGKPINQAAESLGVSRSTLKRFCREHGISSWPLPKRSKKTGCVTDPKMSHASCSEKLEKTSSSARFAMCHKNIGIYQITLLIVGLRRWRNKTLNRLQKQDSALFTSTGKSERITNIVNTCSNVEQQLSDCSLVYASSKQSVRKFCELGMGMVMVKVTLKNDMLKFRFPVSSGLLELKNEVAQRVNLHGKRLSIRYKDEGNDLVCITCDADLHALPDFLDVKSTIRLHAQLVDD